VSNSVMRNEPIHAGIAAALEHLNVDILALELLLSLLNQIMVQLARNSLEEVLGQPNGSVRFVSAGFDSGCQLEAFFEVKKLLLDERVSIER